MAYTSGYGRNPDSIMNIQSFKFTMIGFLVAALVSLAPAAEVVDKADGATMKIYQQAEDLRKEESFEEAERLLTEAMAAGNDHVLLHLALAVNHAVQKNYKEASKSYRIVWIRTGDILMLESYAVVLMSLQDWDELRKITEDLVDHFDKLKEARLAVVLVAAMDGDRDLFDRALVKIPLEEIRQDEKLASLLAQAAKKLAHDSVDAGHRVEMPVEARPDPPAMKAGETTVIPYKMLENKMLEKFMKVGSSKKFENVECTALYLNHTKKGVVLNAESAKFRIRSKEGPEVLLKWDSLADVPEADLTPAEKKQIDDGATRRLWVPKDPETHADSEIVWDLPKGSVKFLAMGEVSLTIPLNRR